MAVQTLITPLTVEVGVEVLEQAVQTHQVAPREETVALENFLALLVLQLKELVEVELEVTQCRQLVEVEVRVLLIRLATTVLQILVVELAE
jgi:hypothetical protein